MSEQVSPLHGDQGAVRAAGRAAPRLRLEGLSGLWARSFALRMLLAILVLGGYLRLTHNNWDDNSHQHPDERFISGISGEIRAPSSVSNYFDTTTSRLNPYNIRRDDGSRQGTFVYGTLPLFLNKAIAENLGVLSLGYLDDYDDYDHYNLSGRALAGLLDLGTVVLIFLIAQRLSSRRAGLLAAFLYAVAPFPIQNAHFFIVDPFVTFFVALTLYFGVRTAQDGGWGNMAAAGAAAGLAAACKVTAISLLPVVLLAIGVRAWPGIHPWVAHLWDGSPPGAHGRPDGRKFDASVGLLFGGSLVVLLAAFVAFRIAMPYAFNSPDLADFLQFRTGNFGPIPLLYPDVMNQHWIKDQVDQRNLLGGNAAFPPNVQWIGRSKWIWPLQQMVSWGMSPAFGIVAWLGVPFAAIHMVRRRQGAWLVPLAWVLGYFGFMGAQFSLYMRYYLPLYPALAVFAGLLLHETWRWATSEDPLRFLGGRGARLARLKPAIPYATVAAILAVPALTMLAGLAFYNIYREPLTRVEASRWIYANVEDGAFIGHEHWDDIVPYPVPGAEVRSYDHLTFNNFEVDRPERVEQLLTDIDTVDYVALASRRLSGTIPRAPAVWPITSRYYETLESGELGFEKVAEFTSHPKVLGLTFDDTGAEESFSVYDHPTVTVYRKTEAYSAARAREVLGADAYTPGLPALPGQAGQNGLLFRPDVAEKQREGGTWTDIFDAGNVINRHPLIFWLLAMEAAAFSILPLALVLFRGLPDRGFLLTKPLGVLILAYMAYAPSSYGVLDYTRGTIALGLGVMALAGALAAWRWRGEVFGWLRERWRFVLFAQAFFLLFFVGAYWLRLQNPDLWHPSRGGEKPMDFAYFVAVTRTTDMTQGPIDPWNAGGYLNYYYFGQFIAATMTKLTGIVPEVAYNLVVPMFFALSAAAVFSVTYNLAEGTRALMRRRPGMLPISGNGPIVAALLAVFLVLLAGNLKAVAVLEANFARISPWDSGVPVLGGVVSIAGGIKEIVFGDASLKQTAQTYDWWDPSRALDVVNPQGETAPITEFPFWTFLFADLHAHLMAIPFSLAAMGVMAGAVMNFTRLYREAAARDARAREVASWSMVALIGLIVGALRWINSWDYPPFLILGAAALLLGERAKEGRFTGRALALGAAKSAVMGALSFAFFAPFAKNYNMFYSGFHQSDQTTELEDFLSHFGILLFLVTGLVLFALARALVREPFVRSLFFNTGRRRRPGDVAPVLIALAIAVTAMIYAGTTQRWGVTMLSLAGLIAVAFIAIREIRAASPAAPVLLLVYAMIGLGFGLTGGVEVLTLDGDIQRMNTVFKFYLHVWQLWGIAGAFGLWYVFGVVRPQAAFMRKLGDLDQTLIEVPRYAFAVVGAGLVALALVYPYFGTRARIHDRFDPAQGASINGMDYMETAVYKDYDDRTGRGGEHVLQYERDGINWLREHVEGTPTTIEGVTFIYHYGARISIYTGLPTVSGWGWHQSQQRARFASSVEARQREVDEFYATTDVSIARETLERYDVEWVIVGSVERNWYPEEGIKKFEDGLGGALELAYANPGMQIWHVIPEEELEGASASAAP